MSLNSVSAEAEKPTELGEVIGFPLGSLSEAIDDLRRACNKLQVSMTGVNGDLEEANTRLTAALKVHTETASYLESILASVPSGVIVVNMQGHVVLFNKAAEAITGFTSREVKGRSYLKTIGQGVPQQHTPLYTLATGSSIDQQEKMLQSETGRPIPVSFSTALLMDGGGNMKGAIEILTDLSRTKVLEEEVSRARTLAAIGEVAAVVAHEIRNPLGGIKGFASLLERDLEGNSEGLGILGRIREGIEALERITADLLETGRHTKLRFNHTEVGGDIIRLVEMFEMAAKGEGKTITFEVTKPDEPLYCRIDRDRMRQALSNLLRNATEAVGESGVITIRLSSKDRGVQPDGPSGGAGRARDYLCMEVSDTGPGISKDLLDKVFAPFFTTKRGGTGLGLSTARRIVALHGGRITYSRPKSGGSTFAIEIPRW